MSPVDMAEAIGEGHVGTLSILRQLLELDEATLSLLRQLGELDRADANYNLYRDRLWKQFKLDAAIAWADLYDLDYKRLYGPRIWELFELCGRDIERFRYHLGVELPHQETGIVSFSGKYSYLVSDKGFRAKRCFGTPGSFWALEHPPTETDYEYPIV